MYVCMYKTCILCFLYFSGLFKRKQLITRKKDQLCFCTKPVIVVPFTALSYNIIQNGKNEHTCLCIDNLPDAETVHPP